MKWTLRNMLRGAAMVQLYPPREDSSASMARLQAQALARGLTLEQAVRKELVEVLVGQLLLTLSCGASLVAVLYGATAFWPLATLVALGLLPLFLCEGARWANRMLPG